MAIVLAALSALFYGTADFSGGFASRRNSISAVLIWSQVAGLLLVVLFSLVDRSGVAAYRDLAWGVVAGIGGMGGLAFLYRGLTRGYVSIVSPLAAVLGAAVPVFFGVLAGEAITTLAGTGIAVSLPAIGLMSWNGAGAPTHRDPVRRRASWIDGALSGILFGLFFVAISMPGENAGMWPLVAARFTSITVMWIGATIFRRRRVISTGHGVVLLAGILDMAANIAFVLALRDGLLAIVTMIASAYPAQTVLLSRVILGEKVGVIRTVGIVLALVGIALMSI